MVGDLGVVESRPLTWDGRRLGFGPAARETAARSLDGAGLVPDLAVDDWVSLHWEWICDRLSPRQLGALRHYTQYHLTLVNDRLDHPGATAALG